MSDGVVVAVFAVPACLLSHHLGRWCLATDPVNGPSEVEVLLDGPDLIVLPWWKDLRWVTDRNPADRHGRVCREDRVRVHDAVDANFDVLTEARAWEE